MIYHGVDIATFHPDNRGRYRGEVRTQLGLPADACVALFVGNLLSKGARRDPGGARTTPGLHLLIVSGSKATAEQGGSRNPRGSPIGSIFVGHSRQVERYFAASDIFLFPTIYEPYGMVISEAMAAGMAVVTSGSAGAAELITHDVDGWVVDPPWDLDGFTAGLRKLVADPAARDAMGQAARRTIEAFTWDRVAHRETLAVYRQIVDQ